MPLKAVFFDLDDTLCNTNDSRQQRAELAAACLVEAHPHLDAADLVGRMLELVNVEMGWPRGVGPLVEELGLTGSDAGLRARGLWFFDGCSDLLHVPDGCAGMIEELSRSYRLAVITNGDDSIQRRKFGYLGIEPWFSVFLTSDRAGCYKPDPAIFAMALSEAGVSTAETVFVGDVLDVDVAGAKAAGMRSIWLDNGVSRRKESHPVPDITIRHLSQLPAALAKLS